MFKALMACVLLALALVLTWSIYSIISSKFPDKDNNTKESDVDKLIKELKIAIALAEVKARNGQKEAEAELLQYKEDLKKAEEKKSP